MKKLGILGLLLLFIFIVLFSLTTCNNRNRETQRRMAQLYGTWSAEIDGTQAFKRSLERCEWADEFPEQDIPVIYTVYRDFNEDATTENYIYEEELAEDFKPSIDQYVLFWSEKMYKDFEEQGIDREAAAEAMQKKYGMPVEKYLRKKMEEIVKVMADNYGTYYYWNVNWNKECNIINVKNMGGGYSYKFYTLEGDTLTLITPTEIKERMPYPDLYVDTQYTRVQ